MQKNDSKNMHFENAKELKVHLIVNTVVQI